jgi:Ca-activated chloride channel family protein
VGAFFDKVNHPVLTNLRLDLGAVRTDLVYPRVLPDLFKGTQLALVGRYRNAQELRDVTIRLTGNASPTHTYTYPGASFPLRAERHEFLPRLWATRRVGWLMEQIRTHGENRELVDEVTELGTRFGIVTPYTSFLALEPGMNAQDFSGQGVAQDAAGRPSGVRPQVRTRPSAGNAPPPSPMAPPPPPTVVTGQSAVSESRRSRERQDALTLEEAVVTGESTVQRVGTRTFYLRGGVWTDSEIRDDTRLPETAVTFGSDEYFALIRRIPALAPYLGLGEQVAVVHEGRIYRIRAPGQ